MHFSELFSRHRPSFSFEFFPPKSANASEKLFKNIGLLESLKPSFVSVTYGAGGSTRELTHELVLRIKSETRLEAVPHLTCVCHEQREIDEILERYAQAGVSNILALGGDLPEDRRQHDRSKDAFRYAAELVEHIQKFNARKRHPHSKGFGVGVAGFPEGHPATPNRLLEMDYLKAKVDAGADYICTQLFFSNSDFYDFRERCFLAGIKIPIIAGIMPITSEKGMRRMADLAGGAKFPAALLKSIQRCQGNPEGIARVGQHWATEQCRDLLDHEVDGIHFYTLNQSMATQEIYKSLGLRDSHAASMARV